MDTKSPFKFWNRTARLRVYRHGAFHQHFCIQQLWVSDAGEERWEDLEEFREPQPPRKPSALERFRAWLFKKVEHKKP
jgi:hypothetical protein